MNSGAATCYYIALYLNRILVVAPSSIECKYHLVITKARHTHLEKALKAPLACFKDNFRNKFLKITLNQVANLVFQVLSWSSAVLVANFVLVNWPQFLDLPGLVKVLFWISSLVTSTFSWCFITKRLQNLFQMSWSHRHNSNQRWAEKSKRISGNRSVYYARRSYTTFVECWRSDDDRC